MQRIDDIARERRVVVIVISQMSRAAARAARGGETTGAQTTDGGAESAAIERAASVTLAIGESGQEFEDGSCSVSVSIGKARMFGGDRVLPMSYVGQSGRWRVAGDARPAAEVKAERKAHSEEAKARTMSLAIQTVLDRASEPLSRREIREQVGGNNTIVRAAASLLLDNPNSGIVEVWSRESRDTCACGRALAPSARMKIVGRVNGAAGGE